MSDNKVMVIGMSLFTAWILAIVLACAVYNIVAVREDAAVQKVCIEKGGRPIYDPHLGQICAR